WNDYKFFHLITLRGFPVHCLNHKRRRVSSTIVASRFGNRGVAPPCMRSGPGPLSLTFVHRELLPRPIYSNLSGLGRSWCIAISPHSRRHSCSFSTLVFSYEPTSY